MKKFVLALGILVGGSFAYTVYANSTSNYTVEHNDEDGKKCDKKDCKKECCKKKSTDKKAEATHCSKEGAKKSCCKKDAAKAK